MKWLLIKAFLSAGTGAATFYLRGDPIYAILGAALGWSLGRLLKTLSGEDEDQPYRSRKTLKQDGSDWWKWWKWAF